MGEWRYSSSILELGTIWRWVVRFTRPSLYPGESALSSHWMGGWMGPRTDLHDVEMKKIFPLPRLKLRPLCRSSRNQSLYQLRGCYCNDDYDIRERKRRLGEVQWWFTMNEIATSIWDSHSSGYEDFCDITPCSPSKFKQGYLLLPSWLANFSTLKIRWPVHPKHRLPSIELRGSNAPEYRILQGNESSGSMKD
jgi:hypothetical protein